jgi:DNA repair protein RecN (Recombination protein N)
MLKSLHIENFAIIDCLELEFGKGLNILTGETGAGKTIIAQALNLILGDRASSDMIRSGEECASVTAVFSLENPEVIANEVKQSYGIASAPSGPRNDIECELIIHRVVSAQGKGKITINGIPATQQMLKEISERLVDISSQHEHQLLLDPRTHARILDRFGELKMLVDEYAEAHGKFTSVRDELERLRAAERETKERLDFMKYQLQELKGAQLKARQDEELETERQKIRHAVQLEAKMMEAEKLLYDSSGSAVELLDQVCQQMASCAQIDPAIIPWRDITARVSAELADVAREMKKYAEKLDSDPARLEEVEDRLHLIKNLKKKYGGTIEACLEKQSLLAKEIDQIERWDEVINEKEGLLAGARKKREQAAQKLSLKRKEAAKKLETEIEREAAGLGFKKLKFTVDFVPLEEENWDADGAERIEFLIAPNVGEKPRPLVKIVSGGELSRIMLAVKRVLSDRSGIFSTSVFDEVDAGIGGATAEIVGRKLKEVAQNRQVICITHLPQIASFGDNHFVVSKKVAGGRTTVEVEPKTGKDRTEELARMMGGTKITETTLAHAEEMLKHAGQRQN